ncbi:MAG: hypothetical protein IPL61_07170 [Myxococcales bacterium]|nr:hypothetical protein [Myxococcales bacterium]
MAIPADRRRSQVARELASLALSCVQVDNPMARVRAAVWSNALSRLGVQLPLFVIHDLGVLLTAPRGSGWVLRTGDDLAKLGGPREAKALTDSYRRLVTTVAASDVVEKLAGMRLRDELVGVLLTRILGDTFHRWRERERTTAAPLPLDLGLYADVDPLDHWKDFDAKPLWSLLAHLGEHALHVLTSVELIDLDTVRLLGMFKDGAGGDALGGAVDLVDLFAALGSPEAHDVANFSLELLPSVLETRRATAVQTFAVDGYASIERKGNVDSLVLSELAYDREIFEQKVVDHELLYYGRERQREEDRRLQYVLIDSSASMRGQRQVFARGLVVALLKKLTLQGDEVWLRFFDSRLHETVKIARSGQVPVPYLLSFKSERGRNYGKVFRQLGAELARASRDHRRQTVLYIVTHGQCHLPPDVVAELASHAFLYGIIISPSTDELPDFVATLQRSQVVSPEIFASRQGRRGRALDIVSDAGRRRGDGRGRA